MVNMHSLCVSFL